MFGKIENYVVDGNRIEILFSNGKNGNVFIVKEDILNIYSSEQKERRRSKALTKEAQELLKDSGITPKVERERDRLIIQTEALRAEVFDGFYIDLYDAQGNVLCKDYRKNRTLKEGLSKEDIELLMGEGHEVKDGSLQDLPIQVVKQLEEKDSIYGLGDKTGFLNKRGYEYEMWNTDDPSPHVDSFRSLYKSIPFLMVLKEKGAYGIFFDQTYKSYFNLGKENREYYFFGAEQGDLDYYLIGKDTLAEVLKNYTFLTGRYPLPQRFTLGNQQSRWGYETAEEVLEIAENYRKEQIPCDTIHLDIDYMDHYKVFTWNEKNFKEPGQLIKELKEMGFKVVTIIDPGVKVEKGYYVYEEGMKNGYFAKTPEGETYVNVVWPGDSVYPDFGDPKVQQWWGDNQKFLVDLGVRGVWNDMNEPASFNGPLPDDVVFTDGDRKTDHAEIHNVYGHFMAEATYAGLKKWDKRRPYIITRACYAGSQKFATAWTGDNHSLWSHLQMAIPQLCNLGMSGMPFVGTDIAGFNSDPTPELMSRWIQVGVFSPLLRNHSAKGTIHQEPWRFDTQTKDIYRKYVKLRYELIPYLYDLFWEESQTGMPIMRPLVLHYSEDEKVRNKNDEFLFGEKMLVAPVVMPGETARLVYLPEGEWIDYWTRERHTGGTYICREAPIDVCPIYVRAGAILPKAEPMQYIGEKEEKKLILDLYEGVGSYLHYQDNGEDFAYENGEYNTYQMRLDGRHFSMTQLQHGYDNAYESVELRMGEKVLCLPFEKNLDVEL